MADLLGIDRSTYCCYEIGRIHPNFDMILKLSKVLGVHYSEFLESEQDNYFGGGVRLSDSGSFYDSELQFGNLSDEEKYFVVAFRLLSEGSRKEVMKVILNKFKEKNNRGDFNND